MRIPAAQHLVALFARVQGSDEMELEEQVLLEIILPVMIHILCHTRNDDVQRKHHCPHHHAELAVRSILPAATSRHDMIFKFLLDRVDECVLPSVSTPLLSNWDDDHGHDHDRNGNADGAASGQQQQQEETTTPWAGLSPRAQLCMASVKSSCIRLLAFMCSSSSQSPGSTLPISIWKSPLLQRLPDFVKISEDNSDVSQATLVLVEAISHAAPSDLEIVDATVN